MGAVLISPFEVPVEADEPFVAGWERARDFLASRGGFATATLHRALRADVEFRFVSVARLESVDAGLEAIADPSFPGGEMPFPAHPALYEAVHQDGAPDGAGGVVLINPFEVPEGADEEFLSGWNAAREALAGRPGYLGTRLHRSLGPADFRFVNVARWSSPLMFAKALDRPEFRETALPFASHPALYNILRA